MNRLSILGIAISLYAIYLLFLGRWDHVTAFAVVIIMITVLKEKR